MIPCLRQHSVESPTGRTEVESTLMILGVWIVIQVQGRTRRLLWSNLSRCDRASQKDPTVIAAFSTIPELLKVAVRAGHMNECLGRYGGRMSGAARSKHLAYPIVLIHE